MRSPFRFTLVGVAALALAAAGCSSGSPSTSSGGTNWATVTSASAGGGMTKLVAAAKKEGTLNVIALPPTWANYGTIIKDFTAKYGIKVNSALPDGTSQQEVDTIKQKNGTAAAPDVVDVGEAVALANTSLFAPYKVSTWSSIPAAQKDSGARWYNDYGGYMAVGYSSKFGTITSLSQLLTSKFKNAVALNGNPTAANAALNGVMMANLAEGGTASSIAKGVNFFHELKTKGNFSPVSATGATIKSGLHAGRVQLGLPEPAQLRRRVQLEGVHPQQRRARRVLRPGHQQERAAPGGRPAVGGVPVLPGRGRRAEPVAAGRRPPGGGVRDDQQRVHRQDGRVEAALAERHPGVPDPGQATDAANYLAANWAKAVS